MDCNGCFGAAGNDCERCYYMVGDPKLKKNEVRNGEKADKRGNEIEKSRFI